MGYKPGHGLGKSLQGRSQPVEAKVRKRRAAIGSEELPPLHSRPRSNFPQPPNQFKQKCGFKKSILQWSFNQLIVMFVIFRFKKKSSKANWNKLASQRQRKIAMELSLSSNEYQNYHTSFNLQTSSSNRITIERPTDLICLQSSDNKDCLILSDVENSINGLP